MKFKTLKIIQWELTKHFPIDMDYYDANIIDQEILRYHDETGSLRESLIDTYRFDTEDLYIEFLIKYGAVVFNYKPI